MLKMILQKLKSMDKKIKKIMQEGFHFCLGLMIVSSFILLTYDFFYHSPDLYYIGLSVFQLSITFLSFFFICGFAFNEIQKEIG